MKSLWILFLAAIIASTSYAAGGDAPRLMGASGPAPASLVADGERNKSLFADSREDDFAQSPALNLGVPTAAESKVVTTPKTGAPMAIGFRRNAASDAKAFSARMTLADQSKGAATARLSVSSSTAKALRVALDLSTLPADALIAVRGSDEFTRIVPAGRVSDLRKANTSDGYWTPATQGERQYIEVIIPEAAGTTSQLLRINAVSHITVALSQLNTYALSAQKVGQSGSCEINVVCQVAADPLLASTATSVARMIFTDTNGSYLCTGTALNDSNSSFSSPYFYGAHHCISTQTVASTLNTFWFYDSPTCPNGTTVGSFIQRTGGAAYLFSDATSDALLLRLNDAMPAGTTLSGWDSGTLADGVSISGIHHPAGDVKKISRGQTKAGCAATRSCVGWTQGTTEGGSSGSGLFTIVSGTSYYLRGGLYGGSASCANTGTVSNTANTDQYSRLSAVYSSISQYLNATTTGPANNNFVNAITLTGLPASATGTNVGANKEIGEPNHPSTGNVGGASVWWRWTAPSSGAVKVSTAGSSFDTTLGVYTGTAVNALTRVTYTEDYSDDAPGVVTSTVSFQATAGATYRIAVDGYSAATGTIALAITSVTGTPTGTAAGDLSGDGRSDIVWNNPLTGGSYAWLMNGLTATNSAPLYTDPDGGFGWRVVATGDFNGDGKADLLWYNPLYGQTAIWLMNGAAQISGALINVDAPNGWRPVAAGDTNGDGRADIIWWNASTGQSAIWLMNGYAQISSAVIFSSTTNGWRPVATGDFNGDGRADLVWYHPTAGQTAIWLMNSNGLQSSDGRVTYTDSPAGWRPINAGDNNGDGKADLLWYNPASGQTAIWHMNGHTQIGSAVVFSDAPGGWRPVRFADFNGDGRSDILWINQGNAQVAIWLMNGFTTTAGAVIFASGGGWMPL